MNEPAMRVISSSDGMASAWGPLIEAGCGGQPFLGAEQVIKVGGQVREVGGVGAEVVAAAQRNR